MIKLLSLIMLALSSTVSAHTITIDLKNQTAFKFVVYDIVAKYYNTFVNDTDTPKDYCYTISLGVDGKGIGKSYRECINVLSHNSRLIGKELHYAGIINNPGTYQITATTITDDNMITQHASLFVM